ncbi:hypothetical protein [Rossellomorea aquimaris]|nr:hypothetical protein [Rossellomorea aquimaris]
MGLFFCLGATALMLPKQKAVTVLVSIFNTYSELAISWGTAAVPVPR